MRARYARAIRYGLRLGASARDLSRGFITRYAYSMWPVENPTTECRVTREAFLRAAWKES